MKALLRVEKSKYYEKAYFVSFYGCYGYDFL